MRHPSILYFLPIPFVLGLCHGCGSSEPIRDDVDGEESTDIPAATEDPTPDDTPSLTPTPANTPIPEPTPTSTPVEGITLSADGPASAGLSQHFSLSVRPQQTLTLSCLERITESLYGEKHEITFESLPYDEVSLYGFKPETTYECTAHSLDGLEESEPVTFTTEALPLGILSFTLTQPSDDPVRTGYTLYGQGAQVSWSDDEYLNQYDYTVIIDPDGIVRWYLNTYSIGSVDISYLGWYDDRVPALLWGGEGGEYVPPTIRGLDGEDIFVGTSDPINETEEIGEYHHDCGLSQRGDSVFCLVNQQLPEDDGITRGLGFIIKEIDLSTNTVRWAWDSWSDGILQGYLEDCTESSDWYPDCFHPNSIVDRWENDPETGEERLMLYLSIRNDSNVSKIDYETKDILWKLGPYHPDFLLVEADGSEADLDRWFFGEHDAQIHGDRISVYDNGNGRQYAGGDWYSRVVEIEIDEELRIARLVYEYDEYDEETGETDWQERVWGGYDILPNGDRLVARGHCNACYNEDDNGVSALYYLAAGDTPRILWRIDFDDRLTAIYRAEHIDGCDIFHNTAFCPDGDFTYGAIR